MSKINIVELQKIPNKRRTVVTGFAGAGFIGNTALMHTARTENFKQVSYLRSNIIPPLMVLIEGKPKHSFRMYIDKKDELMFLITESMLSFESAWIIGQELMKWLKEKGLKEIIAFEGFPFRRMEHNILGFSTINKKLQEYGIEPLTEGAISGVNASLLDEALKENVPWTTIFIPTLTVSSINYQGAIDAIQVLNKMFNLNVNTEYLEKMTEVLTRERLTQQRQRQQKKGGILRRIIS
jgi:predicted ATP-grasp superfamily ATP-dependent carboligase